MRLRPPHGRQRAGAGPANADATGWSRSGSGGLDWTAWYRLFNRVRLDLATLQETLVAQVVAAIPATEPVVAVAVDGTQLPRTSRRLPGLRLHAGRARAALAARDPPRPALRRRQRLAAALARRATAGRCRCGGCCCARPRRRPLGEEPERTEAQGGAGAGRLAARTSSTPAAAPRSRCWCSGTGPTAPRRCWPTCRRG